MTATAVTAYVSNRSAAMPAQSPTLSPTLSAMTAGLRGSSSGMPGLDLADEVGADVGRLREDAAAEPREHRDQRAAEREADQIAGRVLGALVEPAGEDAVVRRDAEQAETDHEEAGHRARVERDLERRPNAVLGRFGGAHVGTHGDVHPDEARGGREHRTDQEAEGDAPAEVVPEADAEEEDDRDDGDRQVLPAHVGGGALLDGPRDLLHALGSGGLAQQPESQPEAPGDAEARAEQGEEHAVVLEEAGHESPGMLPSQTRRLRPRKAARARL